MPCGLAEADLLNYAKYLQPPRTTSLDVLTDSEPLRINGALTLLYSFNAEPNAQGVTHLEDSKDLRLKDASALSG